MGTPIIYKEAARSLKMDIQRIRTAVSRDVLTQVPGRRSNKAVYKEQVELFEGKAELSKNLLSPEELKQWEYYRDLAEGKTPGVLADSYRLTKEVESPDRELEKKVSISAYEVGKAWRKRFLEGVRDNLSPDVEEIIKKKSLPDLTVQDYIPIATYIQGHLQREYQLDIDRSDIASYLMKTSYELVVASRSASLLGMIVYVAVLCFLEYSRQQAVIIEEEARIALEASAAELQTATT